MFGLCFPTGEVNIVFTDGTKTNIELVDESNPKSHILNSEHILNWVNEYGYKNIDKITYERNNKVTNVSMAEYYYENASKLK